MSRKHLPGLFFVLAMTVALLAVSVRTVSGEPPGNDSRGSPTAIPGLPFNDALDTTEATRAGDDPWVSCSFFSGVPEATVWYSYTAAESGTLEASAAGSDYDTVLVVFDESGSQLGCNASNLPFLFNVDAFATYSIMIGARTGGGYPYPGPGNGGWLTFSLLAAAGPDNDAFAGAQTVAAIPFTHVTDLSAATAEFGEPSPNCVWSGPNRTVWYAYAPASDVTYSVQLRNHSFDAFVAAYTGTSLTGLTELKCHTWYPYYSENYLTLQFEAGTTYYFQVGNRYSGQTPGPLTFTLDAPPPPTADFYYWPSDPSIFDTVQFNSWAYDPAGLGIASYVWDFGDGATGADCCPNHTYAVDGEYLVELTVATPDGRTASDSRTVWVETHDVAITRFRVPNAASAGHTRQIVVGLENHRYEETVTVNLYRSRPGGDEYVGQLTQFVPLRPSNRTTDFQFSYTFSEADAALGKVTFRATAWISGHSDALPADNEAIAAPTTVHR